jgi:PadR family transcriptional regulator, regulatory protein PadR
MSSSHPNDSLDGTPIRPAALILLIALSEGPKHGYRLLRDIDGLTRGKIHPGTATVYRSLRRMCSAGLIEETLKASEQATGGRGTGRREYRITDLGYRVAVAEVERLAIVLDAAARYGLLGGDR